MVASSPRRHGPAGRHWRGEVLRADFTTDDDDIYKASKWEVMDKTTVRGVFEYDQSILEKLKSAKKEDIDQVSQQLPLGRKEEVSEVARRLSSSTSSRGEDTDLHLARVSMYYSESPMF